MSYLRRLLVGSLALSGALLARGEHDVQTTADVAVASRYVFRGEAWSGAVLQPAVNVSVDAFAGGVWASQSLERGDAPELDVYASYGGTVAASASARWEFGATTYHRAPADRAAGRKNTVEPYVTLSTVTASGVAPGVTLFYNATRDAWTGQVQAAYALPLAKWGAAFDFAAAAGRTWAARTDGGEHTYGNAGVTLRYQLVRASASIGWQLAGARRNGDWRTAGVLTAGFRYTF